MTQEQRANGSHSGHAHAGGAHGTGTSLNGGGHGAATPRPGAGGGAGSLPDLSRPAGQLSMVELSSQLERITSWIEAERSREREARSAYEAVRSDVDASIRRIKAYAQDLVSAQQRKISSFQGLLDGSKDGAGVSKGGGRADKRDPLAAPRNLGEAILAVWDLPGQGEPIGTEEIGALLGEVGYTTKASASSIKSSVNQALAKLTRDGLVLRIRSDGSVIPAKDTTARARKYLSARYAKGAGRG